MLMIYNKIEPKREADVEIKRLTENLQKSIE